MAKNLNDGEVSPSPEDEPNSSWANDCDLEHSPNGREAMGEGDRNLPAIRPQYNTPDIVRVTAEIKDSFAAPTGEVSITFNLAEIEAYAATHPVAAAFKCGMAIEKLERGYHWGRRLALCTVATITHHIANNEQQLDFFMFCYYADLPTQKKLTVEEFLGRLIYYVSDYIYYLHGGATKNCAYTYAHGLEYYFRDKRELSYIRNTILEHGPEKLYQAALKRNALEKAMRAYEESGRKLNGDLDQDYLIQTANGKERESKAEPLPQSPFEQVQLAERKAFEEDLMKQSILPPDEDSEVDCPSCEEGDWEPDEEFRRALQVIQQKLDRLTIIALRFEKALLTQAEVRSAE